LTAAVNHIGHCRTTAVFRENFGGQCNVSVRPLDGGGVVTHFYFVAAFRKNDVDFIVNFIRKR
jgi:hypothetical protein